MDDLLIAEAAHQIACGESYFGSGGRQDSVAVLIVDEV